MLKDFSKKFFQVFYFVPFTTVLPLLPYPASFTSPEVILATAIGIIFHLLAPYTPPKSFLDPHEQDRNSTWFLLISCLLVYEVSMVEFTYVFALSRKWPVMLGIGCLLALCGLSLRAWSTKTLGHFFTATITLEENQPIIKDGPYKYLRHPAYLSSMISAASIPFIFQSPWGLLLFVFVLIPSYLYRIHVEEDALISQFGEAYEKRAKETWRLIPLIY
ncbi:MAG: isoprenylcysteine carboxylmethyltransferase family protein [Bdellovibrionales bacterium]|nr:isoprenylcysteine carboxylmethyltransferase family protein [Bdellovibrionales bacterium]